MHNKGNYKHGEKTAFIMGENNSKGSNWERINLKNIQVAHAAQFQENKWPNQKIGQRTKRKTKKYKTREYRQNTLWHKSQQDPLWTTFQNIENKSKNKQMGPN